MPSTKRVRCSPSSSDEDSTPADKWSANAASSTAEKMRQSAKVRRDLEAEEIKHLSDCIPLPRSRVSKLDKATVLRLATSYIQMKSVLREVSPSHAVTVEEDSSPTNGKHLNGCHGNPVSHNNGYMVHWRNGQNGHYTNGSCVTSGNDINEGELMLKALQGFVIFIHKSGTVNYVSEQITKHTGMNQEEVIGQSIYKFVHSDDCKEITKQFRVHPTCTHQLFKSHPVAPCTEQNMDWSRMDKLDDDDEVNPDTFLPERLFYVRLRCFIRKNGLKSRQSGFMLMHCSGRVKLQSRRIVGLVAVVRPMQSTPLIEIRLDGNMFMSRHSLDMMFTFCDPRIITLVGYDPDEVIGKTAYQFHNPQDAPKVHNCHSNLIVKGTSVSKYYRFLGKTGQWVWMQTRATIIYNTGSKPQYIACMNYIIGEDEGRRYLMMEQEEQGTHNGDNCPPGAIDITAIHSPTSSDGQTSGYGSADDEHLCSPGLPSSTGRGIMGKTQASFSETSLLTDMDFMNGFLDSPFSPPPVSAVGGSSNVSEKMPMSQVLGLQVSDGGLNQVSGCGLNQVQSLVSPSQISPSSVAYSPSRITGFTMNDNFDNGDIEMYDSSSDGNNSTNITVTLPSNVNLQGHDTKSLLLSVLKNADKSELLKLNTQLTNALATIQAQGGSSGQPNIHISIESQPKAQTSTTTTSPVPCTASKNKGHCSSKTLSDLEVGAESFFNMSPGGETLMDTCDIFPSSSTSVDINKTTASTSGIVMNSSGDSGTVNQKINDTMAAIFSDLDSSQFPEYNDVFNLTNNTGSDLAEQLLNDVNLGRSAVAVTVQQPPAASTCSQSSYTSMQSSSSPLETLPMATTMIIPLASPSKPHQTPASIAQNNTRNHTQGNTPTVTTRSSAHTKHNLNTVCNDRHMQKQQHPIDLAAAKRGLDDHSYFCSKSPSRSTNGHVKFAPEGKAPRRPQGSMLEHLLTTKDHVNPMRGSDYVAHGISKLHLEESQGLKPNLLKQLLTEDVSRKDCVQRLEASMSSQVRKPATVGTSSASASVGGSSSSNNIPTVGATNNSSTPTVVTKPSAAAPVIPGPLESELGFGEPGLADLDILGTATDMDSLWTEEGKQEDELFLSTEIDEILREESRHQEEWMKEFLDLL